MEKDFIPYGQALALKELGFDEPCMGYYRTTLIPSDFTEYFLETELGMNESWEDWINSNFQTQACSAPTFSQAFRWFRENYDLQYNIVWNKFYNKTPYQYEVRPTWRDELLRPYGTSGMCSTYEEAELACLIKLIEIVKDGKS